MTWEKKGTKKIFDADKYLRNTHVYVSERMNVFWAGNYFCYLNPEYLINFPDAEGVDFSNKYELTGEEKAIWGRKKARAEIIFDD